MQRREDKQLPKRLFIQYRHAEERYELVKNRLKELNRKLDLHHNYIFYLSTPPQLYLIIPKYLYGQGLTLQQKGFRRIIIEKPFGHDLESAMELNRSLTDFFSEEQIYRIDHYLGKETVQNLLVTRFSNGIFEPLWNRNYIQHVEITAAESIGVEGGEVTTTPPGRCATWFRTTRSGGTLVPWSRRQR